MNLRELIGIQDAVSPGPVHIHEIVAFARIAFTDLSPAQHYRFSRSDPSNDPGVEAGPRVLDFPVREGFGDKYSHAACDDLMSRERALGFNHVCLKGRVVQERFPNTKGCAAAHDLVSHARRLNLETLGKI